MTGNRRECQPSAKLTNPSDNLPDLKLENFTFDSLLGQGGMGRVYLGKQLRPSRDVAIKVVAPDPNIPPAFLDQLKQEGDLAANFRHDNLVHVYECGIVDDHYYLAMELLPGGSLRDRIREGMTPDQTLRVVRAVASALAHIHDKGFVHRDIKPGNILFTDNDKPVLVDFGVAKVAETVGEMTSAGYSTGTPAYMSPEQIRGKDLDGRTDLYSLGVVLVEALTGELPYLGETPKDTQWAHLSDPLPQLSDELEHLQPILDKLLAKDAAKRFATARDLVRAIDQLGEVTRNPSLELTPEPDQSLRLSRWGRELVRRKVLRAVALYVAVGWAITEIASEALSAFGFPDQWGNWLVIAFVSGFPLVIVVAWYMEGFNWDPRKAPNSFFWWTIGTGVLIAGLVLIPILRESPPPAPTVPVRPFDLAIVKGASTGERSGPLLHGLVADLERTLSANSDLRLYSSQSAEALLGEGNPTNALPISRLVEISAQQDGDNIRLRVSMQLADSGEVEWTDSLDDELDDFFKLTDRLTGKLAQRLSARLQAQPAAQDINIDAYVDYQRAREIAAQGGRDNLLAGLEFAKQAVKTDPNYADAKALLGNLYLDFLTRYPVRSWEGRRQLHQYYVEAEEIAKNPANDSPELARLAFRIETSSFLRRDGRGWQPEDAVAPVGNADDLISATARYPNTVPIHIPAAFASLAAASSDPDQWRTAFEASRQRLADARLQNATDLELALAYAAYSDDKLERLEGIVAANPQQVLPLQRLGWAHYESGSLAKAAQQWATAFTLDPDTISTRINLLRVLLDLGATEPATALIDRYWDHTALDSEFATLTAALQLAEGNYEMAKQFLDIATQTSAMPYRRLNCVYAIGEVWGGVAPEQLLELTLEELRECDDLFFNRFGDSLRLHRALAVRADNAQQAQQLLVALQQEVQSRLNLRPVAHDFHLRAVISAALGNSQNALVDLDEADQQGWTRYWYTQWHPALRNLHDTENFDFLIAGLRARVNRQRDRFQGNQSTQSSLSALAVAAN